MTAETKIAELKAGRTLAELKKENVKLYYKVKGLASKLSAEKAISNGNFITKSNLAEYRGLIIWIMKNKTNYRGYLNLNNAMTILLNKVESENIVFKTKRGIKGIIAKLAISAGLDDVDSNLRKANGLTILDNTYGNAILEDFAQFRLNALIN